MITCCMESLDAIYSSCPLWTVLYGAEEDMIAWKTTKNIEN